MKVFISRATIAAILLLLPAAYADSSDYSIEYYRAAFTLAENGADVRVRLEILYRVGTTPKSDGFKYVGTRWIKDVACIDGSGKVLQCEVGHEREAKITWHFPEVRNARQAVVVEFTMADALDADGELCTLNVPWAGMFRVPVRNAVYEFAIPSVKKPVVPEAGPGKTYLSEKGGWTIVSRTQSPLADRSFFVEFKYKDSSCALSRNVSRSLVDTIKDYAHFILIFLWAVPFWIIGILNRKKSGSLSGGDGGCGGGGCGG